MSQYTVRRLHIGKNAQLDALAHAAGQVYSRTLVFFWRTVRKQGIWLKLKHLMRLIPTDPDHLLHAHSVDAAVQSFFAGLASWRERRKNRHVRHLLTYKAERRGMHVVLQEECYTSRTCPACGHRRKSAPKGRNFSCDTCGYRGHRDGVGAQNIRYKYRGEFGIPHVVAAMAPATGIQFYPHTHVARPPSAERENVWAGNGPEAARL